MIAVTQKEGRSKRYRVATTAGLQYIYINVARFVVKYVTTVHHDHIQYVHSKKKSTSVHL